jgi:hypothetical protein
MAINKKFEKKRTYTAYVMLTFALFIFYSLHALSYFNCKDFLTFFRFIFSIFSIATKKFEKNTKHYIFFLIQA